MEVLDGTSGAEVEVIKRALVKASRSSGEANWRVDCGMQEFHQPFRETIGEVGGGASFRERSIGRRSCSARQIRNSGRSFGPLPPATPAADLEAEARRDSGAPSGVPPPKKRLQEDFVPTTVEEATLWIRCRQQEVDDAIAQGCEVDVPRLAIAEGAGQLRQWTQPPSVVVNMVS